MNKFDELIGKALTEEDRQLLASHSEPGYLAQAFGLFRGPTAWMMRVVNVASGVSSVAAIYALWQTFTSVDAVMSIKWGIAALAMLQVTSLCKTFMGNRMEVNRLLREFKRLELQMSLLRSETQAPK